MRRTAAAVRIAAEAGWLDEVDTTWEDGRVTAAQRLYLDAFNRFLLARDDETRVKARADMDHGFGGLCIERGIDLPAGGKRAVRDHAIDELLDRVLDRQESSKPGG